MIKLKLRKGSEGMVTFFGINDLKIYKILGRSVYIRNGVGFGFISDQFLFENCLLEIGFGRVTSGYGDWGGGFNRATTSPLKIVIDKNYEIKKIDTDSFYNSKKSKEIEKSAKKIKDKLRIGKKFIVKDKILSNALETIFPMLPSKNHLGLDLFEHPHMVGYFLNQRQLDEATQ